MKTRYNLLGLILAALFLLPIALEAQKKATLSDEEMKTWWQKDLEKDTIPGIGLDRAYSELLKDKTGAEVIVAVLDTKIDILHEDLQGVFWVNTDEIAGNGIDDDNNGYIDDTNGWNFLGNRKGEDISGQALEQTRIVRKYADEFDEVTANQVLESRLQEYELFKKARTYIDNELTKLAKRNRQIDSLNHLYYMAKDTMLHFVKNKNYTFETVDSLRAVYPEMESFLEILSLSLAYGLTDDDLIEQQEYLNNYSKSLGIPNKIRSILGDDENDITDISYGNPLLMNNELLFQHSTSVTGLIAAPRQNEIGIKGISDNILIMPVVMVADGDEHDKDIALGIRYAVDNGADIINMSWGKYFSTNSKWVKDAIIYAAQNDVLLVTAAGNDAKNIDKEPYFPNDEMDGKEFVDNFIVAGGLSSKFDSTIIASFSNYGKRATDIFAPANQIFSLEVKSTYEFTRGTSFASPIIAGTAALLKSYFPKLTAVQLKEIILKSGTKLNLLVNCPGDEEGAPLVPFSELSKTGSILNTYAAIQMAMELAE